MWLYLWLSPSQNSQSFCNTWPPYAVFITPWKTASLSNTLNIKKSNDVCFARPESLSSAPYKYSYEHLIAGMLCLFLCRCLYTAVVVAIFYLCCFLYIFSSLPPSTFTAPGSLSGSASLQRGRSAELQITRCTPKHRQAFPEPLRSPSTDRFGPFSVLWETVSAAPVSFLFFLVFFL